MNATTYKSRLPQDLGSIVTLCTKRPRNPENLAIHPKAVELAEKLVGITGWDAQVFFSQDGATANEAALKLSRLTGRKRVVAALGAFHGRAMGALAMTGQPVKREPFKPLIKGVKHVPYGDVARLKRAVSRRTAMVILEPIMGEAGVVVPPPGYLRAAREICDRTGALLVLDCVQTGMGRTGDFFGFEHEGISPDIITIAKGLGGGLPLGAVLARGRAATLFTPGSHGTTFGGNPIACAAANQVLKEIDAKSMLATNAAKGALLRNLLSPISGVVEVRGRGLLIGVSVKESRAKSLAENLLHRGFLVNAANDDVIRIAPAFIITQPEIIRFARAFAEACEEIYDV